jgi:hypothetical protein
MQNRITEAGAVQRPASLAPNPMLIAGQDRVACKCCKIKKGY